MRQKMFADMSAYLKETGIISFLTDSKTNGRTYDVSSGNGYVVR